MSATSLILFALFAGAVFWGIKTYNGLVEHRNGVANALAQIDVQLRRRFDLVPNLVEVARKYLSHEAATLEAVTRARAQAVGAADGLRSLGGKAFLGSQGQQAMQGLAEAEQGLNVGLGRLLALRESYPGLKADQRMAELHEELVHTENRVGFSRQAYNDEVMAYNNACGSFPDLLVARLAGFETATMLRSTDNAEQRQTLRIQI